MKLLYDNNPKQVARVMGLFPFIGGQLLTPLTRNSDAGGLYAIDNGCFSRFPKSDWLSLLERQTEASARCFFVAMPDVVGSARRTLEAFHYWAAKVNSRWQIALVAQDGTEDLPIPWDLMHAVFIGGTDTFKDSQAAADVIRTAQIMEKHTHVGRVNGVERWLRFDKLGVDTCDGSGVARFDWMLKKIQAAIENGNREMPLLIGNGGSDSSSDVVQGVQQVG